MGNKSATRCWSVRQRLGGLVTTHSLVPIPETSGLSGVTMKIVTFGKIHSDFEKSLREILQRANCHEPVWLEPVDCDLEKFLSDWTGQGDLLYEVTKFVPDTTSTRLLLTVPWTSAVGFSCRREEPTAEWGCCISEAIAVEYAPPGYRLATQLHEALHLFGIDECYDPASLKPVSTCSLASCLMRYGAQSTEVCPYVNLQLRAF